MRMDSASLNRCWRLLSRLRHALCHKAISSVVSRGRRRRGLARTPGTGRGRPGPRGRCEPEGGPEQRSRRSVPGRRGRRRRDRHRASRRPRSGPGGRLGMPPPSGRPLTSALTFWRSTRALLRSTHVREWARSRSRSRFQVRGAGRRPRRRQAGLPGRADPDAPGAASSPESVAVPASIELSPILDPTLERVGFPLDRSRTGSFGWMPRRSSPRQAAIRKRTRRCMVRCSGALRPTSSASGRAPSPSERETSTRSARAPGYSAKSSPARRRPYHPRGAPGGVTRRGSPARLRHQWHRYRVVAR